MAAARHAETPADELIRAVSAAALTSKSYVLSLSNLQLNQNSFKSKAKSLLTESRHARDAILDASVAAPALDLLATPSEAEVHIQRPSTAAPKVCTVCGDLSLEHSTTEEARAHYRSDAHRLNAKRRYRGQSPLTPEEAAAKLLALGENARKRQHDAQGSDSDEIGSISASASSSSSSDDEDEENVDSDDDEFAMKQVGDSARLSLRLLERPSEIHVQFYKSLAPSKEALKNLIELPSHSFIVCLYSAGHFAMALIQDGAVKKSVTEHRYVIRKKQGGAQAAHDSSGRRPKSAGSTLRRHGEMAMRQAVEAALSSWASIKADAIYLGVSTRARSLFVTKTRSNATDGRWLKSDASVRRVPMATRRPTLAECERVYAELTSFTFLTVDKKKELPAPALSTQPLQSSIAPPPKPLKSKPVAPAMPPLVRAVHEACQGDILAQLEGVWLQMENPDDLRNPESGETPLHVAARHGSLGCLGFLLRQGLNPTLGDFRGRLPYSASIDKATRDAFRMFRGEHPDRWEWSKTHIPEPPAVETEEQRAARLAKEKAKKLAKKERQRQDAASELAAKAAAEKEEEARKALDFLKTHCGECAKMLPANKADVFARGSAKFCSAPCLRVNTRKLMAQAAESRASSAAAPSTSNTR